MRAHFTGQKVSCEEHEQETEKEELLREIDWEDKEWAVLLVLLCTAIAKWELIIDGTSRTYPPHRENSSKDQHMSTVQHTHAWRALLVHILVQNTQSHPKFNTRTHVGLSLCTS